MVMVIHVGNNMSLFFLNFRLKARVTYFIIIFHDSIFFFLQSCHGKETKSFSTIFCRFYVHMRWSTIVSVIQLKHESCHAYLLHTIIKKLSRFPIKAKTHTHTHCLSPPLPFFPTISLFLTSLYLCICEWQE